MARKGGGVTGHAGRYCKVLVVQDMQEGTSSTVLLLHGYSRRAHVVKGHATWWMQ
jgi:hypothetical protein